MVNSPSTVAAITGCFVVQFEASVGPARGCRRGTTSHYGRTVQRSRAKQRVVVASQHRPVKK